MALLDLGESVRTACVGLYEEGSTGVGGEACVEKQRGWPKSRRRFKGENSAVVLYCPILLSFSLGSVVYSYPSCDEI